MTRLRLRTFFFVQLRVLGAFVRKCSFAFFIKVLFSHRASKNTKVHEVECIPLCNFARFVPSCVNAFLLFFIKLLFSLEASKNIKVHEEERYSFVQLRVLGAFVRKCSFAFFHKSSLFTRSLIEHKGSRSRTLLLCATSCAWRLRA